ncbi:phage minor head protein [Pseudoruegeria sp. HB172150]|uniref:phage head morphogenesis protein n=1 Tax=Pseudoruegeria sp. HB172150 TaxID=2721164 RepID=UPI001555D4B4|nr:phage minor head protein [Pseudoruegeria sp. HB172150]
MAEPLANVFRKPFPEQIAALRLRLGNLVPTARWTDLWQASHDRAFTVAGAMKADLLKDLADAVEGAISEGKGLEAFRAEFREIVERNGWHGWTGEGTKAGEAWRTRVIYRTNARTSFMAGRYSQLREAGYRYWVYRHGGSLEPRLQHLAWDGLILPADHPFWATHFPPNGWGCSCRVRGARSMAAARRLGGDPDVELGEGWDKALPKTGAPAGIDKGWAYAPGASVTDALIAFVTGKKENLPPELAEVLERAVRKELERADG